MADALFNLKLDDEDRALLDACSEHEKLTRSDIMRRALRFYAEHLGVKRQKQRRSRKPK